LFFLYSLFVLCFSIQFQRRSSISDLRGGGGLAGLAKKSGGLASLFGVFGDAMSASAMSKLKLPSGSKGATTSTKGLSKNKKKKSNAKDKRYHMKQQRSRHALANASPETEKKPHKFGKLAQKSSHHDQQGSGQQQKNSVKDKHAFKMPDKMQKMETRKEFAEENEWQKMMENEKQKLKKKGKGKKK
jgi:hypothetical protein|tara:strand:- start:35 stop:595 length:561 start_codon:yes stop_codon:yes gene_type:complete